MPDKKRRRQEASSPERKRRRHSSSAVQPSPRSTSATQPAPGHRRRRRHTKREQSLPRSRDSDKKRKRSPSKAEQPAQQSTDADKKKPRTEKDATEPALSIQWCVLPLKSYTENSHVRGVITIIEEAKQAGVDILNLSFQSEHGAGKMKEAIEETAPKSVLTHPGFKCHWSENPSYLVSLVSKNVGNQGDPDTKLDINPDQCVPSICMTFETTRGKVLVINTCWPRLPSRVSKQLLDEYINHCKLTLDMQEDGNCTFLIGGFLVVPILLESLARKHSLDFQTNSASSIDEASPVTVLTVDGKHMDLDGQLSRTPPVVSHRFACSPVHPIAHSSAHFSVPGPTLQPVAPAVHPGRSLYQRKAETPCTPCYPPD